jgi:hypothetical protein
MTAFRSMVRAVPALPKSQMVSGKRLPIARKALNRFEPINAGIVP